MSITTENNTKSRHLAAIAFVFLGTLGALFIILPGFVAGIASRMTHQQKMTLLFQPGPGPAGCLFRPAVWLSKAGPIHTLYLREYTLADGSIPTGTGTITLQGNNTYPPNFVATGTLTLTPSTPAPTP